MLYMVAIILKTPGDAFHPLMMYSETNRRVLLGGLLINATSATSVVPSWWMFVGDHISVGQQHFQTL
jgi:hypothetical protein